VLAVLVGVAALALAPAAAAQTGFPFQDESLHYSVNWPSGLSLGDATFTAHHKGGAWELAVTLDAGIPGFAVADKIRSSVTDDLCSLELERDISHGARKTREKTTFDQKKGEATRTTVFPLGGGTSTLSFAGCPRDALAFLYFARRELGQGRVPPAQSVFFGSAYSVRMDYTGAQTITLNDKPSVTDHLVVTVKGPKSSFAFEMFFARDAARTPLLIRRAAGSRIIPRPSSNPSSHWSSWRFFRRPAGHSIRRGSTSRCTSLETTSITTSYTRRRCGTRAWWRCMNPTCTT
jgi:hypothetical protein